MKDIHIPESEHSKELFAYFGLAVYYCQSLEQQLTNLLLLTKLNQGTAPTESELAELYQRKLGNSLGQLIKEIQHYFPFSEEETAQLQDVWKQRNHIVHDYFKERIQETFTQSGRSHMIRELKRFKNKASRLEAKLQEYCNELYAKLEPKEKGDCPEEETAVTRTPSIMAKRRRGAAPFKPGHKADERDRADLRQDGTRLSDPGRKNR